MGRLIDADFILNKMETTEEQPITYSECYAWDFATALLNNAPTIEAIPKADYENRLKADMVAMLTEIRSEIEEEKQDTRHLHHDDLENAESYNNGIDNCIDTIQQKINDLKAESEDKE